MAELLIAASEKCKCINQEKLMENEDDNNSTQDLADSPGDAPLLHQSMHVGVGMCVCVHCVVLCMCMCVCVCVCLRNFVSTYTSVYTSVQIFLTCAWAHGPVL